MRVRQVCETYGLTKPFVFALLKDGRLSRVKIGGVLLIPTRSIESLIADAPSWLPGDGDA